MNFKLLTGESLESMINKRLAALLILSAAVMVNAVFADMNDIFEAAENTIKIGQNDVKLQYPAYIHNDRLYVSIRGLCNKLGIPIEWNSENGEVKLNVNNKKVTVADKTLYNDDGVIPDEETAIAVGKIILERYAGIPMEYETDLRTYYLRAEYLKDENAWLVVQNFKNKNQEVGGSTDFADFANVKLNKNTGEVLYVNTYSSFKD